MQRRDGRHTKPDTGRGKGKWSDDRRRSRCELGQNFLKDRRIAHRIVAKSGVGKDDLVVELGAGGGMLTRQLARVARRVVVVEYDPYWALRLRERFSDDGNVLVVHENALKVELPEEPFTVVANVPFCTTTSILHRLLDDPTTPPESVYLMVQKQVALKHARTKPTTLKTLHWSPWYRFSTGLELPADAFHPKPQVAACLMIAAKRGPLLVQPCHRHLFLGLVRQAFEGRGNSVGRVLRPTFTRTQLRRLAKENRFTLDLPPSMLTVHQWTSLFDFMVRMVPQDQWPHAKQHARRERRR
jgi:23S rRNA (adenine-N6)-dimethyltransferase